MIAIILISPFVLGLALYGMQSRMMNIVSIIAYAFCLFCGSIVLYINPGSCTEYFSADSLSVLFLMVLAVLFLGVSVYNADYFRHSVDSVKRQTGYCISLLIFIASMAGVILCTHLALTWVLIEATTLSSAYLINYDDTEASLEAAWKYLFICSIGIAIAFIGIILLSMGLGPVNSLFFHDLHANIGSGNFFWIKLSLPFILVGFGTKVGFAPVHAWLPDAHSEAPSPVSALLSGALLNSAVLAIIKINKIYTAAGLAARASTLLLILGFLSLFVAAVYIGSTKNYKRMLAYSSIENMGIIAIGLGLGGVGTFAALLHVIAHSLAKGSLFLAAGTILHRFKTKNIADISALIRNDAPAGWLWMLSFVAIAGFPPFPVFFSKFLLISMMFATGKYWMVVLFMALLLVVLYGMGKNVFRMSFGGNEVPMPSKNSIAVYIPPFVFLMILIVIGLCMPVTVFDLIQRAMASL